MRAAIDASKKAQPAAPKVFEVSKAIEKVDELYKLERKIIEVLLLYGTEEEDFEELTLETNEEGEITYKAEIVKTKVFEKIYLDLQEDEIEFANDGFKDLYFDIINNFNQKQDFKIDIFINQLQPEKSEAITHILMDEEKHVLHNWEGKDIYVKDKKQSISQLVSETILNMRRFLIDSKINEIAQSPTKDGSYIDETVMQDTKNYQSLNNLIAEKLNRVL